MAKKATGDQPSMSSMIRQYLSGNPRATNEEIHTALASQGVSVKDSLISAVRYRPLKGGGKRKKPGKRRAVARSAASSGGRGAGSRGTGSRGTGSRGRANSKAKMIERKFHSMGKGTRPRDVIVALAAEGVSVTSSQVSTVRSEMRNRRKVRAMEAALGSAPAANSRAGTGGAALQFGDLLAAKQLADRLGGIESLRSALAALDQLSK